MKKILTLLFLTTYCIYVNSSALPENVVSANCKKNDPNLNACLLKRAKEILPIFCDGIPKLGIPGFDPLFLKYAEYDSAQKDVNLRSQLKNIVLTGHRRIIFRKISFNPQTLSGHVVLKVPELRMKAEVKTVGSVLNFPVDSHALFNWLFIGVNFAFKFQLRSVSHKGVEYYVIKDFDLHSYTEDASLELKTLFPAHQYQDGITEAAFNSNPRLVLDTMNKFLTQSVAEIYRSAIDYTLYRIPANEILRP